MSGSDIVVVTRENWAPILSALENVGADDIMEQIYDETVLYQGAPDGCPMPVHLSRRDYWELIGAIVCARGSCQLPLSS